MDHDARIQAAIADLESQERMNFKETAKKWNLDRTTLARRFRGETGSNQDATSYARRQLTDVQEKTLIEYINKLSNRGLPPTPQIVKNLRI
jgi:AraC-like DNA-binding protein